METTSIKEASASKKPLILDDEKHKITEMFSNLVNQFSRQSIKLSFEFDRSGSLYTLVQNSIKILEVTLQRIKSENAFEAKELEEIENLFTKEKEKWLLQISKHVDRYLNKNSTENIKFLNLPTDPDIFLQLKLYIHYKNQQRLLNVLEELTKIEEGEYLGEEDSDDDEDDEDALQHAQCDKMIPILDAWHALVIDAFPDTCKVEVEEHYIECFKKACERIKPYQHRVYEDLQELALPSHFKRKTQEPDVFYRGEMPFLLRNIQLSKEKHLPKRRYTIPLETIEEDPNEARYPLLKRNTI